MTVLELCCWFAAACVLYAYAGYPLCTALLARVRARPVHRGGHHAPTVSVIIAAYNEEAAIERRLRELTRLLAESGADGEILVVSDGSSDGTAALARTFTKGAVRVLELPVNVGKAAALTAGCAAARYEIVVFADARQSWAPDTLVRLLESFADPAVGAVSGDLVVESAPGVLAGVGFYWRFEKWLRRQESRVHSSVGVTGAVCAVRRALFRPIPARTVLDDVYWPLVVAMQGYRVVHDDRARAYDRLPEKTRDEFRRKVRTLSGNFQLLARLPGALLPWRNPIWFQFLSHKVARLVAPWALLALLGSSMLLPGPVYGVAFWGQVMFYLLGLVGICSGVGRRVRLVSVASSFLVLNCAAWLAFWVYVSGRATKSWGKVLYELAPRPSGTTCPVNSDSVLLPS